VHVEIKPGFDLAALSADSKNPSAVRLLDFLGSPAAKQIFEKEGFTVLVPGGGA
jgi:ABC-type molybdate transport system substrate-binding protein